jgi:hypothetical protein
MDRENRNGCREYIERMDRENGQREWTERIDRENR